MTFTQKRGYPCDIGDDCRHPSPANARGFVMNGVGKERSVPTREELIEALHHATATRARLAKQPGTHGQRAQIIGHIDTILDQLADLDQHQPCLTSSASAS